MCFGTGIGTVGVDIWGHHTVFSCPLGRLVGVDVAEDVCAGALVPLTLLQRAPRHSAPAHHHAKTLRRWGGRVNVESEAGRKSV